MKKIQFTLSIFGMLLLAACGAADSAGNGTDAGQNSSEYQQDAFYISSEADLPTCDASIKNRLVYVKTLSEFKTCDGYSWSTVSIGSSGNTSSQTGTNTKTITKKWKFHVDSYVGEPNISSEANGYITKIGDIRIYKFFDESLFVTVSGLWSDLLVTPTEKSEFSHTFFVRSTESFSIETFKLDVSAKTRIQYTVRKANNSPTFEAVVDVDGYFWDNTEQWYILTEVP
jgi:hypothetical protein